MTPEEKREMDIPYKCKSGPLGPEVFDNDFAPLTDAEKLAKYGKEGLANQAKLSAKLKAIVDKIKKARRAKGSLL
jgi:hypothetical protein